MPFSAKLHKPTQTQSRPSACRRGYGWAWSKPGGIREAHLKASPLCEDCKARGLIVPATEVDHLDGDSSNNDPDNLSSKCKPCHSRKTCRENGGLARGRG